MEKAVNLFYSFGSVFMPKNLTIHIEKQYSNVGMEGSRPSTIKIIIECHIWDNIQCLATSPTLCLDPMSLIKDIFCGHMIIFSFGNTLLFTSDWRTSVSTKSILCI